MKMTAQQRTVQSQMWKGSNFEVKVFALCPLVDPQDFLCNPPFIFLIGSIAA